MNAKSTPCDAVHPRAELLNILRDETRFATGNDGSTGERLNRWFDRLLIQSGAEIAPVVLLLLCLLSGWTVGGLVFIFQENLLTAGVSCGVGTGIPVLALVVMRIRRQRHMLRQIPGMVSELARTARTGRSLEQCLEIVAEDTPMPLGTELRQCALRVQMGVGLGAALEELPERTGLVSLDVFVSALTVHQQTGGDLVRVLERLSRTVNDRLAFLGRLRAATTASRATAVLMLVLPPAVLAFFVFRDPAYFSNLMASTWGRATLIVAGFLQLIGSIWIVRILKTSGRS